MCRFLLPLQIVKVSEKGEKFDQAEIRSDRLLSERGREGGGRGGTAEVSEQGQNLYSEIEIILLTILHLQQTSTSASNKL